MCLIAFQGHPSNFKVTRDNKSLIQTRIERFRTVALVWSHRWLWNDQQSLKQHRSGALWFFKVIHQISRPHELKNRRFESNLSKITRPVAAIKFLRFALLLNVCCWYAFSSHVKPTLDNYNKPYGPLYNAYFIYEIIAVVFCVLTLVNRWTFLLSVSFVKCSSTYNGLDYYSLTGLNIVVFCFSNTSPGAYNNTSC